MFGPSEVQDIVFIGDCRILYPFLPTNFSTFAGASKAQGDIKIFTLTVNAFGEKEKFLPS
jgi:hypothetical protein